MNDELTYDYCASLQHRAITDAYFYLDMGDTGKFKRFMELAREALTMCCCCLVEMEPEVVH